jgi:Tfp pilus assembly protein PilF
MTDESRDMLPEETREDGEMIFDVVEESVLPVEEPMSEPEQEAEVFAEAAVQPPTFLERIRGMLFGSDAQMEERLRELTHAITMRPTAPSNYVLRGELYLDAKLPDLAAEDFQTALELASAQFETRNWGIVAQAAIDRAQAGIKKAQKLQGKQSA